MLQKRGFEGLRICPLCKSNAEMSTHLFASCSYVGNVWNGMISKLEAEKLHEAIVPLEGKTKSWWNDERVGPFEAFPILFVYSIWEARNKSIFNNTWIPPDIVIPLLMRKLQEHKRDTTKTKIRIISIPEMNKEMPWAFFDRASQGSLH